MLLDEAIEILKSNGYSLNGYALNEAIKKELQPFVNRIVAFCEKNDITYDYGTGSRGKSLKQFYDHIEMFYKEQRIAFFSMKQVSSSSKYKTHFTCNVYEPFINTNTTSCSFGLSNRGTTVITDIDEWENMMMETIKNIDKFQGTSARVQNLLKFWQAGGRE